MINIPYCPHDQVPDDEFQQCPDCKAFVFIDRRVLKNLLKEVKFGL